MKMKKVLKELKERYEGSKPKKKEKKKKIPKKYVYQNTLTMYQLQLYELICMINGIDKRVFILSNDHGVTLLQNLDIDAGFKKASKLKWGEHSEIYGLNFRGKFMTLLLKYLARNSHAIIKRDVDEKSYKKYLNGIDDMLINISGFVTGFLSSNFSYANMSYYILKYTFLSQKVDSDIATKFEEARCFLKEACRKGESDDLIINNLLKLAYVLSTNSVNFKKTPEYLENLSTSHKDVVEHQIGELGYAIMHRFSKSGSSALINIFVEAEPLIETRFKDIEPDVAMGVQALMLTGLLLDDDYIWKFINMMIK